MLRVSTEEDNYQDLKTPPRSPSNSSMESAKEDPLIRCHSLKSPSKRKDLRSSAIIRCVFRLSTSVPLSLGSARFWLGQDFCSKSSPLKNFIEIFCQHCVKIALENAKKAPNYTLKKKDTYQWCFRAWARLGFGLSFWLKSSARLGS